jgi:molecular chaperone GrpE (heat shock protein)
MRFWKPVAIVAGILVFGMALYFYLSSDPDNNGADGVSKGTTQSESQTTSPARVKPTKETLPGAKSTSEPASPEVNTPSGAELRSTAKEDKNKNIKDDKKKPADLKKEPTEPEKLKPESVEEKVPPVSDEEDPSDAGTVTNIGGEDESKLPNANTSDSLRVAFFVVILILLSLSIFTNILLFKWRFKTSGDQISIVPTELLKIIKLLNQQFDGMAKQHSANIDQSKRASKNTEKLFHDLIESFTDLQAALNKRDKEIERLKKGYDSEVFRKFLTRFIRVDKALCDEIHAAAENSDHRRNFERIQEALRDAFEDCGVSTFSPKIGGHLRKASGVAENPKTKPTSSQEKDLTIAEVTEPGFKLQVQEGPDQCLKPAKVIVYRFSKGD